MTDFYVCNETGDDSNIGLESQPLKTIHRASTLANAGSTIYVLPGIYRERIIPQKSGIRNKPITYKRQRQMGFTQCGDLLHVVHEFAPIHSIVTTE